MKTDLYQDKQFKFLEFEFTRKPNTKHNFHGVYKLLIDEFGIIYKKELRVLKASLNLFHTKSWTIKRNSQFQKREKLFKLLNLKFNTEKQTIVQLNNQQLKILEKFISKHINTTNNISSLLTGSNPTGSFKYNNNSEFIIKENKGINFTLIIDKNLKMVKNLQIDMNKIQIKEQKPINFNTWKTQYDVIKNWFTNLENVNKKKGKSKKQFFQRIKSAIETSLKTYHNEYELKIKNERQKYGKNIVNKYGENWKNSIFMNNNYSRYDIEKAHIKGVKKYIVPGIFKCFEIENIAKRELEINNYLNQISDYNNFLPLKIEIHRKYDTNRKFYWNSNGKLVNWDKDNKTTEFKIYKQIPKEHLTAKRIEYLKLIETQRESK